MYALSRINSNQEALSITLGVVADWQQIKRKEEEDLHLKELISELKRDPSSKQGWSWTQGQFKYKGRMALARNSPLKNVVLSEFHSIAIGGHEGFLKTYKRMARELHWVRMKTDVQEFVKNCATYQVNKYETFTPVGFLQP